MVLAASRCFSLWGQKVPLHPITRPDSGWLQSIGSIAVQDNHIRLLLIDSDCLASLLIRTIDSCIQFHNYNWPDGQNIKKSLEVYHVPLLFIEPHVFLWNCCSCYKNASFMIGHLYTSSSLKCVTFIPTLHLVCLSLTPNVLSVFFLPVTLTELQTFPILSYS